MPGGKTELLKENEQSTGVGADMFIRKKKPGPQINVGYQIDIFENGVKVDTKEVPREEDIKQYIDAYKEKYNTTRSFQEEKQLHITYKTKEERGEAPPPKQTPEPKEQPGVALGEKPKPEPIREEVAMATLDQVLIKKAGRIEELLNRLVYPSLPIKKRAVDYSAPGSPPTPPTTGVAEQLPETPIPGETTEIDTNDVAKQMVTSLVNFFLSHGQDATDDLYNGVKEWRAKEVEPILNQAFEVSSGGDRKTSEKEVWKIVKDIASSGDVNKIQQFTGISMTPEAAQKMQQITLMPLGDRGKPKEQQESTTVMEPYEKAASLIEEQMEKILGSTRASGESDAIGNARSMIKEIFGEDENALEELAKKLPDNFSGVAVEKAIKQMLQDIRSGDADVSVAVIEARAKDFWKYAHSLGRTTTIEHVFEEWVEKEKLALEDAAPVWIKASTDINDMFTLRKAYALPAPYLGAAFKPVVDMIIQFAREPKPSLENVVVEKFKDSLLNYWTEFGNVVASKMPTHATQTPAEQSLNVSTAIAKHLHNLISEKDNLIRDFIVIPAERGAGERFRITAKNIISKIQGLDFSQLATELRERMSKEQALSERSKIVTQPAEDLSPDEDISDQKF
jgi:predicted RNA-binding protein Jag